MMPNNLDSKLSKYYTNYYKGQLGLPDWESRVESRLNEEDIYCRRYIELIQEYFDYDFANKKVLVVGCGTGGELVNFHKKGADVYGIEPSMDAIEICLLKAELHNIKKENVVLGISESLPFEEKSFDFIYCFTVLEHVSDVKASIVEMVRCVKPQGKIFIETPDYRQLYEGHYKLPLPMILPNWFNKIILIILGRPHYYIDSINKISSKYLQNIFSTLPVTPIRVYRTNQMEIPNFNFKILYVVQLIQYCISHYFGIDINQLWLLVREK